MAGLTITEFTLTDGIFKPFPIPRPMGVEDAVREAGLVKKTPSGLEFLDGEWIHLREWVYEAHFVMPEGFDLAQLLLEGVRGACRIIVNGHDLGAAACGASVTDLSRAVLPDDNVLRLAFAPDRQDVGLFGGSRGVRLAFGNYLRVTRSSVCASAPDALEVVLALSADVSGKYLFRYQVTQGDRRIADAEIIERLRVSDIALRHALACKAPVPYDPSDPEETLCHIKCTIERAGVLCQTVHALTAFVSAAPTRIVCLDATSLSDAPEEKLALVRTLGIDGVALENDAAPEWVLAHGLVPRAVPSDARHIRLPAMAALATLRAMEGSETCWPQDRPLWRITESDEINVARLTELFGVNAAGDLGRASRLTRLMQALDAYGIACLARVRNETVALGDPFETRSRFASSALVERDLTPRPGFYALQAAWQPTRAFVDMPLFVAPGSVQALPLWLLSRARQGIVRVDARVCAADKTIADAAFTASLGENARIGALQFTAPETACVLRVSIIVRQDDDILASTTAPLPVGAEAPLNALANLSGSALAELFDWGVQIGDHF